MMRITSVNIHQLSTNRACLNFSRAETSIIYVSPKKKNPKQKETPKSP